MNTFEKYTVDEKVYYALRISIAMCFIGHGSFGIMTKQIWCNYFGVFGIGQSMAYKLMPVIGVMDILFGLSILAYPMRSIPAWLVIWGIFTALLRPLSGEPFAEFLERAGNYGTPFALLLLVGIEKNPRSWFQRIHLPLQQKQGRLNWISTCLKVTVFLLLLGHGWLNLIEKQSLLAQYNSIGFSNALITAQMVGYAEIAASIAVLVMPANKVIIVLFIWKVLSELFYPQYEVFEWIERGGSYGAIFSLWMISYKNSYPVIMHKLQTESSS